ncbi:MAG: tetratricopeptide repeat protein [Rhodospirillales bacterium]|nr:tetratricopeptide repeat protein [Rhodospirillales bacterium]
MSMKKSSSLILVLATCSALTACQTAQSTTDAQLRTSSMDGAIERAADYTRKPSKSISYLERVYKQQPDSETAAVDYAIALRENNQYDVAAAILEPFAKSKSASSLSTSEYAAVQLAQGNYEAAEKYAQKAIIADEVNFKAYHRLGIALDTQGMHQEAERAYRKGLELWQGDPTTIMNNLALNLASQGYLEESIEILRKAQDVSPDRVEIERNLRIVTALQQADGVPAPKPSKKPATTKD